MSLVNMESVNIVRNETKISDKVNAATAPSANLPKENSSNEHGNSSQKNLIDPKGDNDKKEPKLSKSKKKKKNARKGKNKDSLPAPQNETKDGIKTHDSEPEKSGEVSIGSDKEEHKNSKTEVLLDQPSVPAIQVEHETDPTITQRQAPISEDIPINEEASGTKLTGVANLGTKASNVKVVNSVSVQENTSISPSDTVSTTLESKQQDTPPNPDGLSEISYSNPSSANDHKQDEFNVQDSSKNVEELDELSKLKDPHLIESLTDESVRENVDLETQVLTNNPTSETGDLKAAYDSFMEETTSSPPIEDKVASTPLGSESRSFVPEKTFIESLRDAAINEKTSGITLQNEDSITFLVESGVASTSKILMNLEDKIVKDVEQTLSTINLGKFSQLIPDNIFQKPEVSSTQLKETDIKTEAEQQNTSKTSDDNNGTGITLLHSLNELTDITSELLNINSDIRITPSNNLSESNASVNAEISEVKDLSDSTVATSEHVTSEVLDVSGDVRHIVQPEASISETSAVLDGNIINNKEIDMTELPALAEQTTTSMISLTDLKNSSEKTEVIETNSKEIIDAIDPQAERKVTEDKVIRLDENEVSEPIGDISTNEEVLENHPNSIQTSQSEPSYLCLCSKILKVQDKELTPDVLTLASETDKRAAGTQDHAESITDETFQSENWKNSLESTADKAISFIDTKIEQTSNLIGMLGYSKFEFPNREIVSTPSDSKNDEIHSQSSARFSKVEGKSSVENLSSTKHLDISNSKEKSDSAVDLDEVKSDAEVSSISPTNDVFGSSASQAEITNKTKFKFKPSVGEQALAPGLVTISKETLDLLYKRLDSMQLEIERLSLALKSQNETTPASLKDESNSSLKDDYVIAESSQQNSKTTEGEEIVNKGPLKQTSKNKSIIKPSCLWRLMSIFGYKTVIKSDAGLVTRSVSENLLGPSPQGPKGKGKEIIAQPNKPSTARTYKVIGRVRAKHDSS